MKKYAIGLYEKAMPPTLTWREKLAFAKEVGYDFVEISIDEKDEKLARLDWTKEERLELVKTMVEVGLPIRSMCLSGHRKYPLGSADPTVRARGMEIMEKAIQLADDLGPCPTSTWIFVPSAEGKRLSTYAINIIPKT